VELIAVGEEGALDRATAALDGGELIIVPGDERYLLVGDALDDDAVERVMRALGRGADDPPVVLVGGYEDLHHVAYASALAGGLSAREWPGPTVLVLKARPWLPDAMTGATDAVRVSAPRAALARELARRFGPIAAAAIGDAKAAAAARAQVGSHAALVVDGGALPGGRSLVVDARGSEAKVIREGTSARAR
jgi:tRNA threonylcarbamoyl adenosine modification protein (Sua5/YciO/YrdC/YwlC family)